MGETVKNMTKSCQVTNLRELQDTLDCVFLLLVLVPCHRPGLFSLFQIGVCHKLPHLLTAAVLMDLTIQEEWEEENTAFHKQLLKSWMISQSCSCGFGALKVDTVNWWSPVAATQECREIELILFLSTSRYSRNQGQSSLYLCENQAPCVFLLVKGGDLYLRCMSAVICYGKGRCLEQICSQTYPAYLAAEVGRGRGDNHGDCKAWRWSQIAGDRQEEVTLKSWFSQAAEFMFCRHPEF